VRIHLSQVSGRRFRLLSNRPPRLPSAQWMLLRATRLFWQASGALLDGGSAVARRYPPAANTAQLPGIPVCGSPSTRHGMSYRIAVLSVILSQGGAKDNTRRCLADGGSSCAHHPSVADPGTLRGGSATPPARPCRQRPEDGQGLPVAEQHPKPGPRLRPLLTGKFPRPPWSSPGPAGVWLRQELVKVLRRWQSAALQGLVRGLSSTVLAGRQEARLRIGHLPVLLSVR
jgi:hypothetical protein